MPTHTDPTRTASSQPYRTTKAAQRVARQLHVYATNGRPATIHRLADVLSPKTRATLAALEEGGRS